MYVRAFEPRQTESGPSGLADLPRPFVLRAAALDGRSIPAGGTFSLYLHLFDLDMAVAKAFAEALSSLSWSGLGPASPRVRLVQVSAGSVVEVALNTGGPVSKIAVRFLTPTALKQEGAVLREPRFDALFARARDRVSKLRHLYQDGRLEVDFRAMGERARSARMIGCEVRQVSESRRSGHSGQRHEMQGFIGEAEYEGDLGEFLPILRAGFWTGVGSQTVWGFGAITVI
jgi:CRISPR/Cas system endoribonuclease Cas6 (RAMP superfamily)